jgi:hypothetical protein
MSASGWHRALGTTSCGSRKRSGATVRWSGTTLQEIGELWKLSANTVTRLFRDEPGVLKLGSMRLRRGRRSYVTLRIPASVVERVHRRLRVR